jgi:hypothetical protein
LGIYIEQRLLGMALADPKLFDKHPDLHEFMVDERHRRIWRVMALNHTAVDLAEPQNEDVAAYLIDLAVNESFCPQNFPAYVRVLKQLHAERGFKARLDRMRPQRQSDDPFKGRGL